MYNIAAYVRVTVLRSSLIKGFGELIKNLKFLFRISLAPFVPLLPIVCILVNIYLLINLGAATWIRVSVWLVVGVLVYAFYGRTHSSLLDAVYVPATHADEIYRSAGESLA
ncbi:hypothetical protein OIU76_023872 [Salix suchowensis]|nr:hypothetical protein OIU76_023872 [Salix suchowensis]